MVVAVAMLVFSWCGFAADEVVAVEGKVLNASTKQPIEGARIVLTRTDRGTVLMGGLMWDRAVEDDPAAQFARTVTGFDGAFRFEIESPAVFLLTIACEGYVDAYEGNMRRIRLEAGESKNDFVIQLQPQGTIRGRVIDVEAEQPVSGMRVRAHRPHVGEGFRSMRPGGISEATDEDGRYAIDGLEPGDYYLEVVPEATTVTEPQPVEDFLHAEQKAYGSYWYPGAESVEQAAPVTLVGGGAVEGVDIPIAKRRVASIRGRVLGEMSAGEVQVSLARVVITVGSRSFGGVAHGTRPLNSEFQIDGLLPGSYSLTATATSDDLVETRYATLKFELGEGNMDGLDLHLISGVTVNGQVRMQGREPQPGEPVLPVDDLTVRLAPPSGGTSIMLGPPRPVQPEDGSVDFVSVHPDSYLIRVMRPPEGYKLSEVRYNGSAVLYDVVTIDPAAKEHRLEMTLAPASGSVTATATTGFRPAEGATVIVAPETVDETTPTELLLSLLSRASADEDGRATIGSLLPGTYRVIAYPRGALWGNDPYLVRRLISGEEVEVGEAPATVQVRTLPAP